MAQILTPDLCVIGAGSGGLSVAAAAVQLGANVVLIEKHKMGGDCLNTGCVPSKALLAAAKRAQVMRSSSPFGVTADSVKVDFARVMAHVHEVIGEIAPNDSVERFTGLGVHVIEAAARFRDKRTVIAGAYEIRARRFVISTGSSAALPPIANLAGVPFLTNENLFDLQQQPAHLLIAGGGPIGLEMAQAFSRLGTKVTVIEAFAPMARDDSEAAGIVLKSLRAEGIKILEQTRIERVEKSESGVTAHLSAGATTPQLTGSHLLIATGRKPNIEGLGLDLAGIEADQRGIKVGRTLLTSNRRVFAIGDVIGGAQFTHVANYHAGIVIRRALFRLPAKTSSKAIPWVTYTDPELAQVGLTEEAARKRGHKIRIQRWPYSENDRARAELHTNGFIKVITTKKGRILGVTIVGHDAGELIQMWTLAITNKLNIKAMTGFIAPYPTLSEISKRAAYSYFTSSLTSPLMQRMINWLGKLG